MSETREVAVVLAQASHEMILSLAFEMIFDDDLQLIRTAE
jgi:hypothetical protein